MVFEGGRSGGIHPSRPAGGWGGRGITCGKANSPTLFRRYYAPTFKVERPSRPAMWWVISQPKANNVMSDSQPKANNVMSDSQPKANNVMSDSGDSGPKD